MLREILRRARRAVVREIGRARTDHAPIRRELARDQRRILELAEPDPDVDAVAHEIDDVFAEAELERDRRIRRAEFWNRRREHHAEASRATHAKLAVRRIAELARGAFGRLELGGDPRGVRVASVPGGGRAELA